MNDTKTDTLIVRIPPALKQRAKDAARKENRTLSSYIVNIIDLSTKNK